MLVTEGVEEVVLCIDCLEQYECIWDFKSGKLRINGYPAVTLTRRGHIKCQQVIVQHYQEIHPRAQQYITARVTLRSDTTNCSVRPAPCIMHHASGRAASRQFVFVTISWTDIYFSKGYMVSIWFCAYWHLRDWFRVRCIFALGCIIHVLTVRSSEFATSIDET